MSSPVGHRVARLVIIDATVLAWVLIGVTIALLPAPGVIVVAIGLGIASTAINLLIMRQLGSAPQLRSPALAPRGTAPQGLPIN